MPVSEKKEKKEAAIGPTWLDCTQLVPANGLVWLTGYGSRPADIMFISDRPNSEELNRKTPFCGDASRRLIEVCTKIGIDIHSKAYCTYAVKYISIGKKAIGVGDLKLCNPMLQEEIRRVNPKVIVCLGSKALAGVFGNGVSFDNFHGTVATMPDMPNTKVVATYHPALIFRNPAIQETFEKDLKAANMLLTGQVEIADVTDYVVIQTVQELEAFKEFIFSQPHPLLALDCEWHGITWMDPNRYFRTIQLGYAADKAAVIELTGIGGVQVMDDIPGAMKIIKSILEDPRVCLAGQNVISDGEWLLSFGIDVRPRVIYDTMLAEYLINELGPFGLEVLTCKYTKMGRYDQELARWREEHKKDPLNAHGFGYIPREILIPYAACDVTATWRIMVAQKPILESLPNEVFKPRGQGLKYPSLWENTMETQRNIYELEMTGMLVDVPLLEKITEAYESRLQVLENLMVQMAAIAGAPNFNHRSNNQKIKLLFDILKLQPIKTTKGKAWGAIRHHDKTSQAIHTPAVDKTTLEIYEHTQPLVKMLLNIGRIDTIVKNHLKEDEDADEASRGGGIKAKIWPDGRVHPHFSQLSDTGRFRHSKPNSANWPKKGESYMPEIFGGKDKVPPPLRTVIVPATGHVFMEGDFVQAELFVLAALADDRNMWDALTTPGKDMHDLTAISSFSINVVDVNGNPVSDDQLVALATRDKKAFKEFQETLTYVASSGKRMTRKEFKDSLRVSAKNLNFGIPYGRGAADIARQVKAETGTDTPLDELEADITKMMQTWKEQTYTQAWAYMEACAASVIDPGFLQNPWGRRRRFPRAFEDELNGLQREAQNFPIQSTVADTCMIAMQLMVAYRQQHNLHFRLVNQVHDAIMLEVPEAEIEQTKVMFRDTMGSIDIPINATRVLRLGIDVEVLTRWGEKQK